MTLPKLSFIIVLSFFSLVSLALAMEWVPYGTHGETLSSGRDYGDRDIGGGASTFHGGEDWYSGAAYEDEPFHASHGGTVNTGTMNGYGNVVTVTNGNVRTLYGHANDILVENNSTVAAGENIGLVGNTGNTVGATGIHLHYEIQVLTADGTWTAIDPAVARDLMAQGLVPGTDEFTEAAIAGTIAKHGHTKAGVGFSGSGAAIAGEGGIAGPGGAQCDPGMFSIADQLQMMYQDMANQTISDLITQPTSVAQLSCLDQLSAKYGSEIGNKFLDDIGLGSGRADFEGIINDTFIGSVIDNFMGGALSGIQEAVNGAISNTISDVANAILPGVGGGIGNLLGGGTDFDCQIMKTIWELIQCVEFPEIPKIFDLDFGGSFLSRPDSCEGQALYDGALEMLNESGVSQGLENWSIEQSQELNRSIRCSIGSGSDC